jgi:hypothetical protein
MLEADDPIAKHHFLFHDSKLCLADAHPLLRTRDWSADELYEKRVPVPPVASRFSEAQPSKDLFLSRLARVEPSQNQIDVSGSVDPRGMNLDRRPTYDRYHETGRRKSGLQNGRDLRYLARVLNRILRHPGGEDLLKTCTVWRQCPI